jgi:hypothetical protein
MHHWVSTRPSQTTLPVPGSVTLMPCTRRNLSMQSRAQRRVNPATPSFNQMCPTGRRSTASHRSGGSTPRLRSYPASCCFTHGRRRSARLRGRPGSASTLVCLFPSCSRLPHLSRSALAISTSLTCTVITSTPQEAYGQPEGRTRDHPDCTGADLQRLWLERPSQQHSIGGEEQRQARSRRPRRQGRPPQWLPESRC